MDQCDPAIYNQEIRWGMAITIWKIGPELKDWVRYYSFGSLGAILGNFGWSRRSAWPQNRCFLQCLDISCPPHDIPFDKSKSEAPTAQNPWFLECLGICWPPHGIPSDKSKKRPRRPRIHGFCSVWAIAVLLMTLLVTRTRRGPAGRSGSPNCKGEGFSRITDRFNRQI